MIYLASTSPRRRELLDQLGVDYRLVSVDVDETPFAYEVAETYVQRLALAKARAGWQAVSTGQLTMPVLAADTTVVVDGRLLGKPRNRAEGVQMLQSLSGRSHQVLTAVTLLTEQSFSALSCSEVSFCEMSLQQCEAYWASGEAQDKAGAYAIQGRAAMFIRHLSGSYSGVMGLPLFETAQLLAAAGVDLLATVTGVDG